MSNAKQKKSLLTESPVNTVPDTDTVVKNFLRKLRWDETKNILTETDSDRAVKKFLTNPSKNLKWISHEASMLLCSLISVSETGCAKIKLTHFSEADQIIVKSALKEKDGLNTCSDWIEVKLDTYKNFIFIFTDYSMARGWNISFGNRVASVPPNEVKENSDVKVERKGKDIVIGNTIKLEKDRIQNLANNVESIDQTSSQKHESRSSRQKVSGRNAYEIRADVLEMALDWMKHTKQDNVDERDVLNIADSFYQFVEHK